MYTRTAAQPSPLVKKTDGHSADSCGNSLSTRVYALTYPSTQQTHMTPLLGARTRSLPDLNLRSCCKIATAIRRIAERATVPPLAPQKIAPKVLNKRFHLHLQLKRLSSRNDGIDVNMPYQRSSHERQRRCHTSAKIPVRPQLEPPLLWLNAS